MKPVDLAAYATQTDATYSALYRTGYGGEADVWRANKLVSWARRWIPEPLDVIECGCGLAPLLATDLDIGEYLGVDLSSYVVGRDRAEWPDRTFRRENLAEMSAGSGAFDLAVCSDVLEHVPEPLVDRVVGEVCRVAPRQLFSVAFGADRRGTLHVTLRPRAWWIAKLRPGSSRLSVAPLPGGAMFYREDL